MQSLTQVIAVPSAADSDVNFSNTRVPAGAKRISKVTVGIAPDWGTSAASVRQAPVYAIQGSGLGEQSPHKFLGAFGGHATTTDGAIAEQKAYVEYQVDIPVQVGSDIEATVRTLDEAITGGEATIEIQFDTMQGPRQTNSMSDYVDVAGATAADGWNDVGTLTVPTGSDPSKSPKQIIGISIGLAVDNGTSAISLQDALRIKLSGAGIKGGAQAIEFLGEQGTMAQTGGTPVGAAALSNTTRFIDLRDTPIDVVSAGQIDVEHIFDVETPTASTVAVGVLYR